MLAECSPGDYQQRIRRFKIKRPFNLKIDIDQKECSCLQSAAPLPHFLSDAFYGRLADLGV
jgi:hypothetical protein